MTQSAIEAAITYLLSVLSGGPKNAGLSREDLAELRRVNPTDPALPPALWRLLTAHVIADGVTALGETQEQAERAFACLIVAMIESKGTGDQPIGLALATTGYAEERFILLLRARGLQEVAAEVRYAVCWCTTKGVRVRFNARGFGGFILDAALVRPGADAKAHAMARDYFTRSKPQDNAETLDAE